MDVRLPDGRILRNVPGGTTKAQIMAKIGGQKQIDPTYGEGNRARKLEPTPVGDMLSDSQFMAKKASDATGLPSPEQAANFASHNAKLMRGAANIIGNLQYPLPVKNLTNGAKLGDIAFPKAQDTHDWSGTLGDLTDVPSWVLGGAIAKGLPYAPLLGRVPFTKPAVDAVTGLAKPAVGFGKSVGSGLFNLGSNLASGAATGAAVTMLGDDPSKENVVGGMGVGALAQTILPPTLYGAGRGIGWAYDALKGNLSKLKAAEVLRQVAGKDLSAARAAYSVAAPNQTAAQATAGLKSDTIDALGKFGSTFDETSYFSRNAAAEHGENFDDLANMAGGRTKTDILSTSKQSAQNLNQITTPMREAEFSAARETNDIARWGKALQSEADDLAAQASSKVDEVRNLGTLGEKAAQVGSKQMRLGSEVPPIPGLPRTQPRSSYGEQLAQMADRMADAPAEASLMLGKSARFKQMQVDDIASMGLKPVDGRKIISILDSKISNPKIGSETLKEKVLSTVRDRFAKWTDADGIISPDAAYGIRKSAVNDAIEQFMGTSSPKSKAKAAAGLLSEIKPLIDDAISSASDNPKGWMNYLQTFEKGQTAITQQKMAGEALSLLESNPDKFISLVRGNEPKMVEKMFKTTHDIQEAMGSKKMFTLEKIATNLENNKSIEKGASKGGVALRSILDRNTPKFKLFNVLDPRIALINKLLGEGELKIGEGMKNELVNAMKSGKSAKELLDMLPASETSKVLNAMTNHKGNLQKIITTATTIGGTQGGK